VRLEIGDTRTDLVRVGDDLGQRRRVLARQLVQTRAPRLHLGQPLGIDGDGLEGDARLACCFRSFDLQ
jgi:hypothetical protein